MAFQPFSDACDSAFVSVRRWMRAMKNAHLTEQHDTGTRAFPFTDLGTEFDKQGFYVGPSYRAVHGLANSFCNVT
jgi:hypothetical protein